jgi:hypothetical protein
MTVAAGGITTGKVHSTLAGWLGGYSSQADHAVTKPLPQAVSVCA